MHSRTALIFSTRNSAHLQEKPRARLQRGKQARPSAQQKKPRARLQRVKQARSSAQQKKPSAGLLKGNWSIPSLRTHPDHASRSACRAVSLPLGYSLRPCWTSTDSHGTKSTRRPFFCSQGGKY
jgi:hypothetical protein